MQSLKTIALALVIGLGVAYAAAWTGPTQAPPNANVPAPINKGSTDQIIPNNISLKGETGTEGLALKQMFMSVDGMFETHSDTHLATNPGAKVGIGTANPQSTLDVNGDIKVATSTVLPTDTSCAISPLANNPSIQVENTAAAYYKVENGVSYTKATGIVLDGAGPSYPSCDSGWVQGTSAYCLFGGTYSSTGESYTYTVNALINPSGQLEARGKYDDSNDSTSCSNAVDLSTTDVGMTMSDGAMNVTGDISNNNFKFGGGAADLLMRRSNDGDTVWKRALVAFPDKLYLNYDKDFSSGTVVGGDTTVKGNMTVNGFMSVNGSMNMNNYDISKVNHVNASNLSAGVRVTIDSTDRSTWPTCSASFGGNIRFNGAKFYGCQYNAAGYWEWAAF